MKKLLLMIVSILVLVLFKNIPCFADGGIYCSPDLSENLTVLCQYAQDSIELKYDVEMGINAFFIPNSSTQGTENYTKYGRSLNFYIDDNSFFGNSTFENMEIVIEYKDLGLGSFYIKYDSIDGEKVHKDYIELYNTNQTKTAIISLYDATFSNNCNNETGNAKEINRNADFSITAPRQKDGLGIYIYNVTVRTTGTQGGDKIYSDGFDRKINIVYENIRSYALDMHVQYTVIDADTKKLCGQREKIIPIEGSGTTSDIVNFSDIDKYGTYILQIFDRIFTFLVSLL